MDEVRHNCGFCVTHSLRDAYDFIKSLQHRGREAAGIAGIAEHRIDVLKWKGGVDRFDTGNLPDIFQRPYHTFMAHVRYATQGRKDEILEDAHPVVIGGVEERRDDHVIISNCEVAGVHNGQISDSYFQGYSFSGLRTGNDTEKFLHFYKEFGAKEVLRRIPGAYTIAIADKRKREVMVLRDRTGIKPGVLGWKDGKYVVASENVTFFENGAELVEDLELGSVYYLAPNGAYQKERVVEPNPRFCFFEYNYIANVKSSLNGLGVQIIRQKLGEKLADEFNPGDVDLVTFMPRCPEPAARAYADKTGKHFVSVFYKLRGERAFQGSTSDDRTDSIARNLWILPDMKEVLRDRSIVCIDDSTIRGNNSRRALQLLKEAGVAKAYLANYTPKIGIIGEDKIQRGCMFGVDMPPEDKFVVTNVTEKKDNEGTRNRTDEEINKAIGMPVHYLSLEGMLSVYEELGMRRSKLCTFCVGGRHPFS